MNEKNLNAGDYVLLVLLCLNIAFNVAFLIIKTEVSPIGALCGWILALIQFVQLKNKD